MAPLPRGRCRVCGFHFALRRNGTLREHRAGGGAWMCEGSGRTAVHEACLADRKCEARAWANGVCFAHQPKAAG